MPEEPDSWLIFTRRGIQLDRYPSVERYLLQHRESLEPRPADWDGGEWPGRKPGNYAWYEIQDSVDYWRAFEGPQIVHADITWTPEFAFAPPGTFLVNTAYTWSTDDLYLLGVVNSPLMWSYMWRHAQHGKDEALRLIYSFIETLPIAEATEVTREAVTQRVQDLLEITRGRHTALKDLHDWLQVEFGIEKPGQRLGAPHEMGSDEFVEEVKKRRPGKSKVSSAELRRLRDEYQSAVVPMRAEARRALTLEREISDLVNEAYGLTPEEVDLLWRTAPPRMPNVGRAAEAAPEAVVAA